MKRVGLIIVISVVAALLFWRRESSSPPSAKAAPVGSPTSALTPVRVAATPPAAGSQLPEDDQLALVEQAHELVQEAGRVCWDRRTPAAAPPSGRRDETTQYLRVELELVAQHGLVRVAAPHVAESGMTDAALERCIVDGLTRLEFAARAPDGRVGVKELLRMGEYTGARQRAQPPDLGPPPPPPPPGTPVGTTVPVRAGARLTQ